MNHNVKIISIGENEYRVSGTVTYLEEFDKKVTVDGEDYYKTWREWVVTDLDKEWVNNKKGFNLVTIDIFKVLGLPEIKFWKYSNAHEFCTPMILSSNSYVSLLQVLSEEKIIPEIHCGKDNCSRGYYNRDVKDGIEITLYGYGFNNSITTDLSYAEVLKLNIPDHYFRGKPEYFPKGWQKFNDSQKSDLLINFINKLNDRL